MTDDAKARPRPVRTSESVAFGDWDALACPNCGGQTLHHGKVAVYDRTEDAPLIDLTVVDRGRVAWEKVPDDERSGNPSHRRDGVAIDFTCEECAMWGRLTVSQHKGSTYLAWEWDPEGNGDGGRSRLSSE